MQKHLYKTTYEWVVKEEHITPRDQWSKRMLLKIKISVTCRSNTSFRVHSCSFCKSCFEYLLPTCQSEYISWQQHVFLYPKKQRNSTLMPQCSYQFDKTWVVQSTKLFDVFKGWQNINAIWVGQISSKHQSGRLHVCVYEAIISLKFLLVKSGGNINMRITCPVCYMLCLPWPMLCILSMQYQLCNSGFQLPFTCPHSDNFIPVYKIMYVVFISCAR